MKHSWYIIFVFFLGLSLSAFVRPGFLMMTSDWQPTGTTQMVVFDCDTCFRLTENVSGQSGCVWDQQLTDISAGIDVQFTMNFGNIDDNGADGMNLVFSTIPDQCGGSGGTMAVDGIAEAVIVEFDTWTDTGNPGDIGGQGDHIAVYFSGNQGNPDFGPVEVSPIPTNLEDGVDHDMQFTWDAGTMEFEVFVDGVSQLTGVMDLIGFFGTDMVHLGFAGSTGGFSNEQIVCPGIPINPPEEPVFVDFVDMVCVGDEDVPYSADGMGNDLVWEIVGGAILNSTGENATVDFLAPGVVDICIRTERCDSTSQRICRQVNVMPVPMVQAPDVTSCEEFFSIGDLVLSGLQPGDSVFYFLSESEAELGGAGIDTSVDLTVSTTLWLRVERGDGCYQVFPVQVELNNLNIISDPPQFPPICDQDILDLNGINFTDLNGSIISMITWYDSESGIGDPSSEVGPLISEAGQYFVLITSQFGCTDTLEYNLEISPLPEIEVPDLTLSCDSLSVTTSHGGDPFWQYMWFDDQNNQISTDFQLTLTSPGDYSVIVTNQNGCIFADEFSVEFLSTNIDVDVFSDSLDCDNTQTTLQLTDIDPLWSYAWSGPNMFVSDLPEPTVSVGGIYTLIITDVFGCSDTITHVVGESDETPDLVVNNATLTCLNDSVTVSPEEIIPGVDYSWVIGSDTISGTSVTIDVAGIYQVLATAGDDCQANAEFTVFEDQDPPDFALTSTNITCAQDTAFLIVEGNESFVYSWEGPMGFVSGEMSLSILDPGLYSLTVTGSNGCIDSASAEVIIDQDLPTVQFLDTTIDCTNSSLLAEPIISDNVDSIVWTLPDGSIAQGPVLNIVDSGTYVIQVWTQALCTASTQFSVALDQGFPSVTLSASGDITCLDDEIEIQATPSDPNLEYAWSGPMGFESDSSSSLVQVDGWYILEVTNPVNGCQTIDSVFVDIDTSAPSIAIADPEVLDCIDNATDLVAQVEPESAILQWTDSDGNLVGGSSTISVSSAGWYFLTAQNPNGCASVDSVFAQADVDFPQVNISGVDTLTCTLTQLSLLAEATPVDSDITWIDPDGMQTTMNPITVTSPGVYRVEILNSNGCTITDSVEVLQDIEEPNPIFTTEDLDCINSLGQAAVLDPESSWTVTWESTEIGVVVDSQVSYQTDAALSVTVLDESNGCFTSEVLSISIDEYVPGLALTGETIDCFSDEAQLSSSLDSMVSVDYEWSGPGAFSSDLADIVVSIAGVYSLTVTNPENGCSATESFEVLSLNTQITGIDLSAVPTSCGLNNGIVSVNEVVGGMPPFVYFLSGETSASNSTGFFDDLPPGNYEVLIEDANGCTFVRDTTVSSSAAGQLSGPTVITVDLGDTATIALMSTVTVGALQWNSSQVLCDTCLVTQVLGVQSELISISGTDINGCPLEWQVQLIVRAPEVYIPNVFSPSNGDGINDIFFVHTSPESAIRVKKMQIFNRWGSMVFHSENQMPNSVLQGWNGMTKGEMNNPGVFLYHIEIEFPDGSIIVRQGDLTLL